MKKLLGFGLIIALALTACAQQKKTTTTNKTTINTAASNNQTAPGIATGTKDISYINMRRGACFGKCPEYSLELYNNGLARYTGKRNAEYLGTYEKNIGADKVAKIFNNFETSRVDTCSETYTMLIADLPTLTFEFKIGNNTKTIRNANFGPKYLEVFADQIDEIAKVDGSWKKTAEAKKEN